jgi:hypothetical protein
MKRLIYLKNGNGFHLQFLKHYIFYKIFQFYLFENDGLISRLWAQILNLAIFDLSDFKIILST